MCHKSVYIMTNKETVAVALRFHTHSGTMMTSFEHQPQEAYKEWR